MIYIVVPVHNRKELTVRCLDSLRQQCLKDFEAIVIDDGSTDGTSEIIKTHYPEVVLLHGDGNLWWTGATNLGVMYALERASEGDFVLTFNNDTVVEPEYLKTLFLSASRFPRSFIGSVAIADFDRSTVVDGGVRINWSNAKHTRLAAGKNLSELETLSCAEVDVLPGRGTLVPVRAFHEIGLYDFDRLPHYGADYEFSARAQRAGFTLLVDYRAFVYSSVSTTGISNQRGRIPYGQLVKSFFSKRSPNCLKYRWNFARLTHPLFQAFVFFLLDLARVIGGTLRNQVFSKKLL